MDTSYLNSLIFKQPGQARIRGRGGSMYSFENSWKIIWFSCSFSLFVRNYRIFMQILTSFKEFEHPLDLLIKTTSQQKIVCTACRGRIQDIHRGGHSLKIRRTHAICMKNTNCPKKRTRGPCVAVPKSATDNHERSFWQSTSPNCMRRMDLFICSPSDKSLLRSC